MIATIKISADEARAARKDQIKAGADGRERLMKLAAAPPSWDAAKRSARFVMTSQAKDRYGDIVVTTGLDTTEFEKNPQAFFSHKSGSWPIGLWSDVKKVRSQPPRMEGDLVLHPPGGPVAEIDQAAWMIERGGLRAASIGFWPDFNEIEKVLEEDGSWQGGLQFNKSELLECSLVGIPAHPQALAKSIEENIGFAREVLDYALDNWAIGPDGKVIERKSFEELYQLVKKSAEDKPAEQVEQFLAAMTEADAVALCERFIAAQGKVVISRERSDAIERAARQNRLAEKRKRDLETIRARRV